MKKLTLLVMLALGLWACGDTETSDGRSGDGGSGGTPPPPANIDQACRAWCANEPEGLSCHQGPVGSVQGCYEDCLRDYQNEAERQCGDEWIAIKDCQIDLDCEDLFGDCDSTEDAHEECVLLANNRAYCEANCPEFDIRQCEQDTTECRQFAQANDYCESRCPTQDRQECVDQYLSTGSCGSGGTGGSAGSGGTGGGPGEEDPCEGSPSCVFCPADSLDPTLGTLLPDGLTAPIIFTAAPTAAPVAGEDVTIDIDAETFIAGLAVAVSLSVTEGGTTTYVATGSADTAEIDIPLQTVMGAANEDWVVQLGAGSSDFLVDVNATELVVTLDEALVNMAITSPLPLDLTIDATADGPCELSGPGVTIAVSDGT